MITSNLSIDTVGPVITGMFFNRLNGQVDYTIQDPVAAPARAVGRLGQYLARLVQLPVDQGSRQQGIPRQVERDQRHRDPGPDDPDAYDVAVTFNGGATIRGGFYLFTIRDSSNGEVVGAGPRREPSRRRLLRLVPLGQWHQRQRLRRRASGYHNKVFAPQTIIGTSSAANGGVGGPRVGAVHSGVFMPVIPRGGSPVFTSTSNAAPQGESRQSRRKAMARRRPRACMKQVGSHPKGPLGTEVLSPAIGPAGSKSIF